MVLGLVTCFYCNGVVLSIEESLSNLVKEEVTKLAFSRLTLWTQAQSTTVIKAKTEQSRNEYG